MISSSAVGHAYRSVCRVLLYAMNVVHIRHLGGYRTVTSSVSVYVCITVRVERELEMLSLSPGIVVNR